MFNYITVILLSYYLWRNALKFYVLNHFIILYNKQSGKQVTGVSDKVLKQLAVYPWPGNVRELENKIFKGILLSTGTVIEHLEFDGQQIQTDETNMRTIAENERDHIIAVLNKCNWKISGEGGAAEILDIHVSTLNSRIKKLGIKKL